jgi:hypothetical protein
LAAPVSEIVGNTIAFTASWTGGSPNFVANYVIYNTISPYAVIASHVDSGITGQTDSWTYTVPSTVGVTFNANVIITDGATTAEVSNSILTGTFTIVSGYTTPTSATLSASPTLPFYVDSGQSANVIYTATVYGGTQPYTYNFFIVNTITNAIIASNTQYLVSSTTDTFTYNSIPSVMFRANVIVTDSHPSIVNSIYTANVFVSPSLTPVITPNVVGITAGQGTTLSLGPLGGTGPFTYNWLVVDASNVVIFQEFNTGFNTISVYAPGTQADTYYANVSATDTGTVVPWAVISVNAIINVATQSSGGGGGGGGGGGTQATTTTIPLNTTIAIVSPAIGSAYNTNILTYLGTLYGYSIYFMGFYFPIWIAVFAVLFLTGLVLLRKRGKHVSQGRILVVVSIIIVFGWLVSVTI